MHFPFYSRFASFSPFSYKTVHRQRFLRKLNNEFMFMLFVYSTGQIIVTFSDAYDSLVIAGGMGENQIPCSALHEMIRLVKPGRLPLALTVHWVSNGILSNPNQVGYHWS